MGLETVVGPIGERVAAIMAKVEAGASVRSCCDKAGGLTRREFLHAVRADPALQASYRAAIAKWTAPHAKAIAAFDEIERRITAGESILGVLNSDRRRLPDYTSFSRFLKARPEYDARYRAAGRARQAGPHALRQGPQYSPTELRQAATALMLSDARNEIHTARLSPGGIHTQTLLRARFRDPDLLVAVETAVVARRTRLRIVVGGRPKIDHADVRLIAPAPKILKPDPGARLASALSQNDVYRLAISALPKHLATDVRDDIVGDIVMAVLSGDVAPHMIQSVAKRFVREHNKKFSPYEFTSLDKSVGVDSTLSFVDTLTSDDAWEST